MAAWAGAALWSLAAWLLGSLPAWLLGFLAAWLLATAAVHGAPADGGARQVWLDELDVSKATTGWGKAQANKSVEGRPLTVAGQVFARGLGTHGPGVLRVQLDGAATRFTARVGIDDEVAGRPSKASAEFRVGGEKSRIKRGPASFNSS
jgi:hypothetical protein